MGEAAALGKKRGTSHADKSQCAEADDGSRYEITVECGMRMEIFMAPLPSRCGAGVPSKWLTNAFRYVRRHSSGVQ
jgi:hypothetical protein